MYFSNGIFSVILDKKCIKEISRKFLENFEKAKLLAEKKKRSKSKVNEQNNVIGIDLRDEKISDRFDGCSIDLTNVIADAVFEMIQFDTRSGFQWSFWGNNIFPMKKIK